MIVESYSWTVYDDQVAVKKTDMSVFNNYGSGVPVNVRTFFSIDILEKGQSKAIILKINNRSFQAKLERINSSVGQTRIMWNKEFSDYINKMFPNVLQTRNYPELRFFRIDSSQYEVSFVCSKNQDYKSEYEQDILESEVIESGSAEGRRVIYYTTKYERDVKNRREAIRIHGLKCMACGFDFEKTYGELGRDFIEVHHIKPLYDLKQEVIVNPRTDLVCLCSNCHRMIHRKRDAVLTLDQLRKIIDDCKNGNC